MIYFFKILFNQLRLSFIAKRIGYYTHIDYLPIYNWFQILKGNYEYLYIKKHINTYPEFFKQIPLEMLFQFEKLDMEYFEDILKLEYLKALYMYYKKPEYLNKFRSHEYKLNIKKETNTKQPTLNEMIVYIEEAFKNIGSIDVHKMSTSTFFAYYNRAIEKNKPNANTE